MAFVLRGLGLRGGAGQRWRWLIVVAALVAGLVGFGVLRSTGATLGRPPLGAVTRAAAQPTVLYVAAGGEDGTNDCRTAASPCATISHALTQAGSGDTIEVSGTITDRVSVPTGLSQVTISGAQAPPGSPAVVDGGGTAGGFQPVFSVGSPTSIDLDHLTIRNGYGYPAGGIVINSGGTVALTDSTVTGNRASSIYGPGGISNSGTLTLTDSTITDNTTFGAGGAIGNSMTGTLTVTSSTITENTASSGGGIVSSGTLTVTSSTITNNTATSGSFGGGIYTIGSYGGSSKLGATIVAKNSGGNCHVSSGTITSVGYNLTDDTATAPATTPCGFTTADHDVLGVDPDLGPLQNNGGPTFTMLPLSGSPAIGKIPNTPTVLNGVPVCGGVAKDQRGVPRPARPAVTCAIGATEPVLPVAPQITSAPSTTFTEATAGTFTVVSTGVPAPALTEHGVLPAGVTFTDNGDGTATIAGTPAPGEVGKFVFTITADNEFGQPATQEFTLTVLPAPVTRQGGYYLAASDGGVFAFDAPFQGSLGNLVLNAPIVGMAVDPATGGYYLVASDGGVFAFNAPFQGSLGNLRLNAPIVGMAVDPATGGYYLVASDGGVFAFNAPFLGSMGGTALNRPVVGMAVNPTTDGYYLVASDGGVFTFDAPFQGSGGTTLNEPVVGMAVNPATGGYYLVGSDGGVFAFNAPFQGSTGGIRLNEPVVGMAVDVATGGYYLGASDGGVFAFNAPFHGSTGNIRLNAPVVAIATRT